MHESLGIDLLGQDAVAVCLAQQGNDLGLEIGREAGIGLCCDDDGLELALRGDLDRAPLAIGVGIERVDMDADGREPVEDGQQAVEWEVVEDDVAVGHRGGDGVGAGDDAIGYHRVVGAAQLFHAIDGDPRRAGA